MPEVACMHQTEGIDQNVGELNDQYLPLLLDGSQANAQLRAANYATLSLQTIPISSLHVLLRIRYHLHFIGLFDLDGLVHTPRLFRVLSSQLILILLLSGIRNHIQMK